MNGIKLKFENGVGKILWSSSTSGVNLLSQKVITRILSAKGSDAYTDKGSDMEKDLFALGTFNVVGMQHAINFATVECSKQMRGLSSNPEDTLKSVNGVVASVGADRRVHVGFTVQNTAGQISRALV